MNRQWLHSRKQLTNPCSKVAKPLPPTAGENQGRLIQEQVVRKRKEKNQGERRPV